MTAAIEVPQLLTIGEVRRRLAARGLGRSNTAIRRMEERGVVTPLRPLGHDRRLYTTADYQAIEAAIRAGSESPDTA